MSQLLKIHVLLSQISLKHLAPARRCNKKESGVKITSLLSSTAASGSKPTETWSVTAHSHKLNCHQTVAAPIVWADVDLDWKHTFPTTQCVVWLSLLLFKLKLTVSQHITLWDSIPIAMFEVDPWDTHLTEQQQVQSLKLHFVMQTEELRDWHWFSL